jgi:GNAT superfamily N-acetyltransferase
VRPEDAAALQAFVASCRQEDLYLRFFGALRYLPATQLARLTQIDYDREMAFLVTGEDGGAVAEVRAVTDPDNQRAEFAILVRRDWQGRGLGRRLLARIAEHCRSRGTGVLYGEVLASNARMLDLCRALGFRIESAAAGIVQVTLPLAAALPASPKESLVT